MRATRALWMLLALAGCGGQVVWDGTSPPVGGGAGSVDILPVSVTAPTFDGLPCAVKTVLQDRCTGCHGATLAQGAPYGLSTRAELAMTAPAPYDGGTRADRSLVRMAFTLSPMPPAPSGLATAAELATLASWVDAGMPAGSCAAPVPVCSSGSTWQDLGDRSRNDNMAPGGACQSCHARNREGPRDVFMGTVYRDLHQTDDCNASGGSVAIPTGLVVDILDSASGAVVLTFPVLSPSGNFRSRSATWSMPSFRAQVRNPATGAVRQMMNPVGDGDCNTCHTARGTSGAPGRIIWPE